MSPVLGISSVDGFALAILLIALGLASERTDPTGGQWAWFIVTTEGLSLLAGGAVGLLGGLVVSWSRRRDWMTDTWAQLDQHGHPVPLIGDR